MRDLKNTEQVEANINNLFRRYQNYDRDKKKYYYDIKYSTLTAKGETMKAERHCGAENFHNNIKELMENYKGVATITVTDYTGKNAKAKMLNAPVTIELVSDLPKVTIHTDHAGERSNPFDVMQGLSGLFAGTEFEGLGNLAPVVKMIDDKHTMKGMQKEIDTGQQRIAELERKCAETESRCESLNKENEKLKDDAADMEDELDEYRAKSTKQDNMMGMIGLAGASIAKTFLKQHPAILSGLIPAEQLRGILDNEESQAQPHANNTLTDEEQEKLDDATVVFEWLQALESPLFETVCSIFMVIRQNPDYADHIVAFLNGSKNNQLTKS